MDQRIDLTAAIPTMRRVVSNWLAQFAQRPNWFAIGTDGLSVFDEFARVQPDRFIDVGIAEQNALGIAAGLAREGALVWVSAIASFLLRRAYEQLRVDICEACLPVKVIGTGGGLSYGILGYTHHMAEDIALCSTLPNMAIFVPADIHDLRRTLELALEWDGPAYIRIGRDPDPVVLPPELSYGLGEPVRVQEGSQLTIVSLGACTKEALDAADRLNALGYSVGVVNVSSVYPFSAGALDKLLGECNHVLVVEEHITHGGLGSIILESLGTTGDRRIVRMGINKELRPIVGGRQELLKHFGLDAESIMRQALGLLGGI